MSRLLSSSSYPPPLDLPPFPTRRSSDLSGGRAARLPRDGLFGCAPVPRSDRSRRLPTGAGLVLEFLSSCRSRTGSRHQDRKSTRLNSSHEWISYAVFCLKKKKG